MSFTVHRTERNPAMNLMKGDLVEIGGSLCVVTDSWPHTTDSQKVDLSFLPVTSETCPVRNDITMTIPGGYVFDVFTIGT